MVEISNFGLRKEMGYILMIPTWTVWYVAQKRKLKFEL